MVSAERHVGFEEIVLIEDSRELWLNLDADESLM